MSREGKMEELDPRRPVDPDEVEVEDVIRMARERELREAKEEAQRLRESKEKLEDPVGALMEALAEALEEEKEKQKKRDLMDGWASCAAAAVMAGGMIWGLIDPVLAVPLAAVYGMRSAVKLDRWRRG